MTERSVIGSNFCSATLYYLADFLKSEDPKFGTGVFIYLGLEPLKSMDAIFDGDSAVKI